MNAPDFIAEGILTFCAYMSYRGAIKVRAANERTRQFSEEYQQLAETGNLKIDGIQELSKK